MSTDEIAHKAADLYAKGDFLRALRILKKGLSEFPNDHHLLLHRAIVNRRLGNRGSAIKDATLVAAVAKAGLAFSAEILIADLSDDGEDYKGAIDRLVDVINSEKYNNNKYKVSARIRLALLFDKLGDKRQARFHLATAGRLARPDYNSTAEVGRAYRQLKLSDLAICLLRPAFQRSTPPKRLVTLEYALALCDIGQPNDGVAVYESIANTFKRNSLFLHDFAEVQEAAGHLRDAASLYQEALDLEPNDIDFLHHLAELDQKLERYESCIERCNRLLETEPDNAAYLVLRGRAFGTLNKHEAALKDFERAQLDSEFRTTARRNIARALLYTNRATEAIGIIDELFPSESAKSQNELLSLKAQALVNLDRYTEARYLLEHLASNDPDDEQTKLLLSIVDLVDGRTHEAISTLERLHNDGAGNKGLTTLLADAYELTQDYAKAAALLKSVVAEDSNDPDMFERLAIAYARANDYQSALKVLDDLLRRDHKHLTGIANRGILLLLTEEPAGALVSFQDALTLHGGDARLHHGRAVCLEKLGRLSDAISEYERALACDDRDRGLRLSLAVAYEGVSRHQDALKCLEPLLQEPQVDGDVFFCRGFVNLRVGRFDDAQADFEAARAHGYPSRLADLAIARCALSAKKPAEALEFALNLLVEYPDDVESLDIAARSLIEQAEFTADPTNYSEAIDLLNRAFMNGPTEDREVVGQRFMERGYAHAKLANYKDAVRDYRSSLEWLESTSRDAMLARSNVRRIDETFKSQNTFPRWMPYFLTLTGLSLIFVAAFLAFRPGVQPFSLAIFLAFGICAMPFGFLLPYITKLRLGSVELERLGATIRELRVDRFELLQMARKHHLKLAAANPTKLLTSAIGHYEAPSVPELKDPSQNAGGHPHDQKDGAYNTASSEQLAG